MAEAGVEGAGPGRRRRWPWLVLGLLLVLAVAVRVAAPYGIARAIERGARDATGLPVELANVDLGLLRGAVAVDGIVVQRPPASPGASPLLRLRRLAARVSYAALFAGRVELREVAVEGPVLRLLRLPDGSIEVPLPPRPAEEREAEPPAQEGAGWPLRVDRLQVTGLDLELADPGRDAPALGFSLEELALEAVALAGDDLTLGGVGVRGPRLRVERSFVFASPGSASAPAPPPAPATAPAPAPEAASPAAAGPRYRLERVAVERAGITLLTDGGPLDVELDLTAEGVSALAGETFPFELALRVSEGGEVGVEGRAGLAPPSFHGALRWRDLAVPLFVVAARPDLRPWVRSCRAEGELELAVRLEPGPQPEEAAGARLSGRFAVRDLALADPEEQEVELGWRALEVDVGEAFVPLASGATPIRVALDRVRLEAPQLRYARPSPALDALLGGAPPAEAAAEAPAPSPEPEPGREPASEPGGPPLELRIAAFELSGGRIGFGDGTLSAPFEAALAELSAKAQDVRWPGPGARTLQVRGVAPKSAPFSLRGSLDGTRGELAFEIQRLHLPAFDPYAKSAGYHLARGEASLRSSLRIEPERYRAQNDLLLHDLRLDSAEAGAFERQFGTSLDFALALLRDPSGDIRLPVPLAFERSDLSLGLGSLVLGAVRAALVGVVSSPLKVLGAALPQGEAREVDAAALRAPAGSASLAPEEAERVEALRELLRTRPLLAVTLTGRAGPEDRELLARGLLRERAAAGESLPEVEGGGFFASRRVAEALREGAEDALASEDAALFARMVAAAQVPAERFAALGRERGAALREQLVTGDGAVDPARVALSEATQEGSPGVALELVARTEEIAP